MIAAWHGRPANGLVLLTRMFRLAYGAGYGIMAPMGFIKIQKIDGPKWGLFISNKLMAGELEVVNVGPDNMPTIQGPWMLSYLVLLPNAVPHGSRGPVASLYISSLPYKGGNSDPE